MAVIRSARFSLGESGWMPDLYTALWRPRTQNSVRRRMHVRMLFGLGRAMHEQCAPHSHVRIFDSETIC